MKKLLQYAIITIAALLAGGCCHVQVWTEPLTPAAQPVPGSMQPVAYGRAMNSGYYLFNTWPIYTGHPAYPNRKDYHTFNDDIRPSVNADILLNAMRKQYKAEQLTEVEHRESSWGYFSLWILWRKTIITSATGVKKTPETKNKKSK